MKFFALVLVLFPLYTFAVTGLRDRMAPWYVTYEENTALQPDQGEVIIRCYQFRTYQPGQLFHYGVNGSSATIDLEAATEFTLPLAPANYRFQFYYAPGFGEIEIDSAEVRPGVTTMIYLSFEPLDEPERMRKPVIYLYPEAETLVSVALETAGKLLFTYPALTDSWKMTAQPNGDLTIDGKTYPYLFWESEQQLKDVFSDNTGFVVDREHMIAFLEEQLTNMGLTAREQTDFITFWGPQMIGYPSCKVKFVVNAACDTFAKLSIVPAPAHVNRIYILWSGSQNEDDSLLKPQELPVFDRTGFDVLEWGGSEVSPVQGI